MTVSLLDHPSSIAIIGMAGRFPGARTIEQYRLNLEKSVESVTFFSDEELQAQGVPKAHLEHPHYVKAAPLLDDYDGFDAALFQCSPSEAETMDPQHRLLLECAWEALENAGYAPRPADDDRSPRPIGVFTGSGGLMSSYLVSHAHVNQQLIGTTGSRGHVGNDKDYLSTRISYKLNLHGPSLTVQTACSTSLVAVHLACQSLLNGECEMALAGGVTVRVPQRIGYMYQEDDIFSPDGHCRPFSADAQGTIFGSGVGLVLLKRLEDAYRDGDAIAAVIRGSAMTNDGGQKVSYWSTRAEGQAAAMTQALAVAGIEPHTIGYVEAHGTGTLVGDPVEIFALNKAYGRGHKGAAAPQQTCAIGSVKSNIGHLEAAAGIAGLIKAALSLQHKKLFPSLHFSKPNPKINFGATPFYVNTESKEWIASGPRRAAVNSLGIGGTNAHVILEEAPTREPTAAIPERDRHLLVLSARSMTALRDLVQRYIATLDADPDIHLANLCFTSNTGRTHFEHRFMAVVASNDELRAKLEAFLRVAQSH
ncbi:MAG TPA: type I polyketide synthase [Polyangium sp.]|nr:type I polyketide synthase [Polyangium sp.]